MAIAEDKMATGLKIKWLQGSRSNGHRAQDKMATRLKIKELQPKRLQGTRYTKLRQASEQRTTHTNNGAFQ